MPNTGRRKKIWLFLSVINFIAMKSPPHLLPNNSRKTQGYEGRGGRSTFSPTWHFPRSNPAPTMVASFPRINRLLGISSEASAILLIRSILSCLPIAVKACPLHPYEFYRHCSLALWKARNFCYMANTTGYIHHRLCRRRLPESL